MEELRKHFITADESYHEGDVFVFEQHFVGDNIKSAVLYSTALGVYEASVNGEKVGEQMYAPGYTYYQRRLLYQSHDITDCMKAGDNIIRFYLGQGWYCGRFLCENKTQIYGEKPGISWALKLTDQAGKETWVFSNTEVDRIESPYDYAGEYDGEVYYEGRENKVIGKAVTFEGNIPERLEPTLVEVKVQEKLSVKSVTQIEGRTIIDFGQNCAGIIELNPELIAQDVLIVRHGEILNQDGSLYTANLRKAKAVIEYHKGEDLRIYRPRFTYMGFRYVELNTLDYQDGMIGAYAVYSDMKRTGEFHCENEMADRLFQNQVWGQKSNYVEVPTDCPQRDERMGYTGDGQVFALTGSYNFDTNEFWKNFMVDLRLGQMDNSEGYVCATVPQTGPAGIGFISMLGWGNAVTIIPELMRIQYGDTKLQEDMYESMKLFVEAEIRKMKRKNLWIGPSLGDWLAMGKGMAWQAMHNNPVSNAFIVNDLKILSDTARRMGKTEDADRYEKQLTATRNAYLKRWVNKNGKVAGDYQSAYIMALQYVIPKGEQRQTVLKKYVENVRSNGLQTGFFATAFLLPLLVEAGETKLAYDILFHEGCPGWMYQVKLGATTTWERWDAIKPDGTVNEEKNMGSDENMVSFNHYAFGSVGAFYYQYILGIQPAEPGYQKVRICPVIDPRMGKVTGSYTSRVGKISSSWEYADEKVKFQFRVPVEAQIILPDGTCHEVEAGTYEYEITR